MDLISLDAAAGLVLWVAWFVIMSIPDWFDIGSTLTLTFVGPMITVTQELDKARAKHQAMFGPETKEPSP